MIDMKKTVIIAILFIILIPTIFIFTRDASFVKKDKLFISEVMTKNKTTIMDDYDNYPDYIEIYNGYSTSLNLSKYNLSDRDYYPFKWKFPDIEINPGEYLIIYADGKDKCDIDKRICHTNFKLSSTGEKVVLTDYLGNIISKVKFGEMEQDISYSWNGSKYEYTSSPTPGKANKITKVVSHETKKFDYTLRINEYMTHNKLFNISDGSYYDFVELYNYGEKDINLEGLYITTSADKLNKFALPNYTVKSHEYVVIYMTDGKRVDEFICANFKLSDTDKELIISNGTDIYERLELVTLKDNVSYGYKNNKWYYFVSPTPGKDNTTKAYDKMP